jgi:2,5-furandicarboxylate decarboxylase 1
VNVQTGDFGELLEVLDERGLLYRVRTEVDPVHELAGVAATLEGDPRAVLFERVRGHDAPVLTGLYWSRDLLADLLGSTPAQLPAHVAGRVAEWQAAPLPPVVVDDGPVLEVTRAGAEVDLASLPIPTHALRDGGPYVDAGVVVARDPETGVRNASIQRFMVSGRDTLGINIDAGRHLGSYLAKAAARGENLTFSLTIGVVPGVHFAAATPSEAAPEDTDELGIASAFQGSPLRLARGPVLGTDVVAGGMYALECEIVPGELAEEGPFAEVTGYYARREPRPVVHVRAVHHRRRPVFHTILSGVEVWNSVGLLGESSVLRSLQRQVPGVLDVAFTHGGCGFYHAVVQMTPTRTGWSRQAVLAAFAAFPPLKMVTIVDEDVDLRSPADVEWAMATRLLPDKGVLRIPAAFGHGLNPTFPDYLGTKIGFDATRPWPRTAEHDRATYLAVDRARYDITTRETTS